MISKNVIGIYARGGLFAGGGGLFAGGGGLFAGGPFAAGLIAGGLFASGLNAATHIPTGVTTSNLVHFYECRHHCMFITHNAACMYKLNQLIIM